MRLFFKTQAIIIFIMASMVTFSFSQTQWTKYPGNPVMDVGPAGSWDDEDIKQTYVIWDSTVYHMWYNAWSGGSNTHRVGYATSNDGISWTKYLENPLSLLGSSGSWDGVNVVAGPVIYGGELFKMWYGGDDGTKWRAGYATSTNGINWEKYDDPATTEVPFAASDPVLDVGNWDSWEAHAVANSVIFDSEIYKMWYRGYSSDYVKRGIGYATSADGIHWQKDTLNNPILVKGSAGSWDDWYVDTPCVLFNGEFYEMWYTGEKGVELDEDDNCIGYATSADGIHWDKFERNPVLRFGPDPWDNDEIWCGTVFLQNGVYKMWYVGISDGSFIERTCYATSSDSNNSTAIDDNITAELPRRFFLSQNYPNPFNPVTMINYQLPMTNDVDLSIYNLLGQKVATLVKKHQQAGYHQVEWDASGLSSGIYYYRIEAGEFQDVKKMILLR